MFEFECTLLFEFECTPIAKAHRWTPTMVGTNYVFSSAWQGTELNCFGNPPAGVQCTERGTNTDAQWIYTP